ncbi:MAG TPA: DUF4430 domain-containing protein [Candidatus Paceibacterota bacterium]|jgi:hypothetical protein
MHKYFLSVLLISSFVLGSLPAHAQEATPEPVPLTEESGGETSIAVPVDELAIVEQTDTTQASAETFAASEISATETTEAPITDTSTSVSLLIRYGESELWNGPVPLPATTSSATPTGGTQAEQLATTSPLAVLLDLDEQETAFDITQLDYYSFLSAFYINCITSPAFGKKCGEWQFTVNGKTTNYAISQYPLVDGDRLVIYFGQPRRVTLSDNQVVVGEEFTVLVETYDPEANTHSPLSGATVGVTQPVPGSWTPLEVATSTTGVMGTTTFSVSLAGSYEVAIKAKDEWGFEYYEFPPAQLTVASTTENLGNGGGGSGSEPQFDVDAAFAYLSDLQNADGSWDSPIVTDWSAVALAVPGAPSSIRSSLEQYLRTEAVQLDSVLDYERHAMALMALGINPYDGGQEDYITPIVEAFDGTQIGDRSIVNDDIFALIVLLNAGYDAGDDLIKETVSFVLREQSAGSWENSADLTAAAIQALSEVRSLPGVAAAIADAEDYLRSKQEAGGGFADPFATAWVLQAIESLNQSPSGWSMGGKTPVDYLVTSQETDGGMTTTPSDSMTRAWGTAYAIPAAQGLTWDTLLSDFERPTNRTGSSGGSDSTATSTASTTVEIFPVATTTEPVLTVDEIFVDPPAADEELVFTAALTQTAGLGNYGFVEPETDAPRSKPAAVEHDSAATTAPSDGNKGLVAAAAQSEVLGSFADFLASLLKAFFALIAGLFS